MSMIKPRRLSSRDIKALRFIGEGREVVQYQLREGVFAGLSPTVASRFVQRALKRDLLAVQRYAGIGMNRLRLTGCGREILAQNGESVEMIFVPTRAVAEKDLLHTLRINDLRVVLGGIRVPPTQLLPSWGLQRRLSTDVIPDLLAVWRSSDLTQAILACEIDLGTENLNSCFVPKLRKLSSSVREFAGGRGRVLVLTRGSRRLHALEQLAALSDTLLVSRLPTEIGASGIAELKTRLEI